MMYISLDRYFDTHLIHCQDLGKKTMAAFDAHSKDCGRIGQYLDWKKKYIKN